MVNIPSTHSDPQYRYKMPRLVIQNQSSGNGKKTCIVNMADVARALKRPPEYVMKWFSTKLGAEYTYTCKHGEGERALVKGCFDAQTFQSLLDKFIAEYVCCKECGLPEIKMFVKKGRVRAKCASCGWAGDLDNLDNSRLATYIIKNPPDETGTSIVNKAADGGGKTNKKTRRELKAKSRAEGSADGSAEGSAEDNGTAASETQTFKKNRDKKDAKDGKEAMRHRELDRVDEGAKEKKVKKDKKDRKDKKDKRDKKDEKDKKDKKDEEDEIDEKDEKYDEKAEKSKEADVGDPRDETGSVDNGNKPHEADLEDPTFNDETKGIISMLASFVESHACTAPVDDFVQGLRQHLAEGLNRRTGLYVALEALCGKTLNAKAVTARKNYIGKVIATFKFGTEDVLWALGAHVKANPEATKGFPWVLKTCYDEDWVDEEDILSYYEEDKSSTHPGYSQAKGAAANFIKWLKEAESEDDDDDEGAASN